jgi:hypothetical protein
LLPVERPPPSIGAFTVDFVGHVVAEPFKKRGDLEDDEPDEETL